MKIHERGVLENSDVYFHTPSEPARKLFLNIRCVGRYSCDQKYRITRQNYESFLLLYVIRGAGYVWIHGQKTVVLAGALVLLDCYEPHKYGTDEGWDILWCHFSGVGARGYYEMVLRSRSQIIYPLIPSSSIRALEKIFRMFHLEHQVSEAMINRHLVCALTEFLTHTPNAESPSVDTRDFEEVLSYIAQNLEQPITLQDLADQAALSPYYFCRVFKEETGYTPNQYLINARVNAAKFFLRTTDLPNKAIIARCGFNSESGFCTVFRRVTGMTPHQYRRGE